MHEPLARTVIHYLLIKILNKLTTSTAIGAGLRIPNALSPYELKTTFLLKFIHKRKDSRIGSGHVQVWVGLTLWSVQERCLQVEKKHTDRSPSNLRARFHREDNEAGRGINRASLASFCYGLTITRRRTAVIDGGALEVSSSSRIRRGYSQSAGRKRSAPVVAVVRNNNCVIN